MQHNLEFELRLQQYIEMVRTTPLSKRKDAIGHIRKYLLLDSEAQGDEFNSVAGLLVFNQDSWSEKYRVRTLVLLRVND